MKITNHGISNASLTPKQEISSPADSVRPGESDPVTPDCDTYSPSVEWLRMLDLVRQQPEVRPDRVQEVMQRLARGDYDAPDIADKTAEAMLNSLD